MANDRPISKKEDLDSFWDIADMLPEKKKPQRKAPVFSDTEAVTIATGDKAHDTSAKIPPRMSVTQVVQEGKEYVPESDFIRRVKITPWPTDFSFYRKFRSDALRFFDRTHAPCEYVYFFSYMPQYDQMTSSQMAYYLYWRAEFKRGNYLKADNSYVFLLAYEIINLPDKIPPKEGVMLLAKLWGTYRAEYRYMDKYFGEWLCDYCVIHRVALDFSWLSGFLADAIGEVSVPEFFLEKNKVTTALIAAVCAYDYKKSKYYEACKDAYDTHMPAALSHAVCRVILPNLEKYGIIPVRLVRDSFSGAVVCRTEKYRIELSVYPLKRSYEFRQLLSKTAKLCENRIRAAFAIKSRFSPSGLDDEIKCAVNEYFDAIYPDSATSHRKKQAEEEESYMALYEPENKGPADIERALAIEEAAWETAELLETEDDVLAEEEISFSAPETVSILPAEEKSKEIPDMPFAFDAPMGGEDGDFAFLLALEPRLKNAVFHAVKGDFAAYCRTLSQMPERLAGEINEIAMDEMGDIILEEDFTLVSDYADEITNVLNKEE